MIPGYRRQHSRFYTTAATLFAVALLLVLLGGCGSDPAVAPPANTLVPLTETDEENEPTSGTVTETLDVGEDEDSDTVDNGIIDDLPRYPDAEAVSEDQISASEVRDDFTAQTGMDAQARFYELPQDTTFEDVLGFYQEALAAADWVFSNDGSDEGTSLASWTKPATADILIIQVLPASSLDPEWQADNILSVILAFGATDNSNYEQETPAEEVPVTDSLTTTEELSPTDAITVTDDPEYAP